MKDQKNPVNWFEIPVSDLKRAQRFYESILDVELTSAAVGDLLMAWFPMVNDSYGSTGSLVKAEGYHPSHSGTLVYFPVEDIDAALSRVKASGGRTLQPRTPIGDFGFIAHFEDTEGNRLGLHSMK
ncbi:MAG TPA: VOC family protein [Methanothrix sp.]|nr:VOC family protein [Methanothrix sp.]